MGSDQPSVSARDREDIAAIVAAVAIDIDAVTSRTCTAIERLEALDALPNQVVAVRRAAERLAEAAAALRREGILHSNPQQRLL